MSEQEQTGPVEDTPELTSDPGPAPAPVHSSTPQGSTDLDAAELQDRWRRALADLDNLRKRHARDRPLELEAERARVASAWLPVLDNLELALAHADADPGAIVQGVQAVRDQAVEVLRGLGYPRHEETGVAFDPKLHDVASVVDEADAAPGAVVKVLRPGYGDPGRQLRPATVAVSRKQE
ncbi:nucleotide exchange factor GrpE [Streptomyces bobili]|uniref:nucleotide exchange factor GrpE n=1 Tax=Streptomyces bobili TaxID=67280 RepID=UPI0037183254